MGSNESILHFHVDRYKNLRGARIDWPHSGGLAIFGRNGAGKTNLLQALCLVMGSDSTVLRVFARGGAVSDIRGAVDLQVQQERLPAPPDPLVKVEGISEIFDALGNQLQAEAAWWEMIGVSEGATFESGVESSALPTPWQAAIRAAAKAPVIRYELANLEVDEPGRTVTRTFNRTLLASREVTLPPVPKEFKNLLRSRQDREGPWVSLISLPQVETIPVEAEWIVGHRAPADVVYDLIDAFDNSSSGASGLAEALGALRLESAEALEQIETNGVASLRDWGFWLHEVAAEASNVDLERFLPNRSLSIRPMGAQPVDLELDDRQNGRCIELWLDKEFFNEFSSSEARWIDEALLTGAEAIREFGVSALAYEQFLVSLESSGLSEELLDALIPLVDSIDRNLHVESMWHLSTLRSVLGALDSFSRTYLVGEYQRFTTKVARQVALVIWRGLEVLDRPMRIRIFDEPETHLDSRAQMTIASGMEAMRSAGTNVVIATHSPTFLNLGRFVPVHLGQPKKGRTRVHSEAMRPGTFFSALSRDLGLSRGEMLTRINYLLVVEGPHDRLVLEALRGDDLRDAGVYILRMFGTRNALATVDMDFAGTFLDTPIGVMFDNVRVERVLSTGPVAEGEEKTLRMLLREASRQGRTVDPYGLRQPDIICYLNEDAVRYLNPDFEGWAAEVGVFKESRSSGFKTWLAERRTGAQLTSLAQIQEVLDIMTSDRARYPAIRELDQQINEIITRVNDVNSGA